MERLPDKKEINRKIAEMILPVTIEGVLEMVAGIVSMGMIGRIDVYAVSALGISMQITQLIWALFKGIATGAAVYVAQYYGAGKHGKLLKVIQQTLLSSIIVVAVLQLFVYFNAALLLSIFNPKQELLVQAVLYMKVVSFGFPFLVTMLVIAGVFQGMGNARTPMFIALIMNTVNIVVGYALIFGKLGFPHMGIKGAAIATVISQLAAAIVGLVIIFRKKGLLHQYFNRSFFSFDMHVIAKVYRVGLPSAMETIFWLLAGIIVARAVMTFGEVAFAAHQLGVQAESISYMPAAGFGIAATAFVGQALGAGDKLLAKTYLRQIMKGTIMITSASVAVLLLFPKAMMLLLTNNLEVVKLGIVYLILTGLVQIPQNTAGVLGGALRGAGYSKLPMAAAGVGLWCIRVPLALLFTYVLKLPIVAIWSAMSIDLAIRFVICYVLFRKNNIYENNLLAVGAAKQ